MVNNYGDKSNNNFGELELTDVLKKEEIITSFTKSKNNTIILKLNHKYDQKIIVCNIDCREWTKSLKIFEKRLVEKKIKQDHIEMLIDVIDHNYELFYSQYQQDQEGEEEKEQNKEDKKEVTIYKYSENGRGHLHEAAIVNGFSCFIKYNPVSERAVEIIEKIEENDRVLRPPERNEYPYIPYQFESEKELNFFIEKAKEISLDEIYVKCRSIFKKCIDQDEYVITLLSADAIWTYFQDLFSFTHYVEGVGTNNVGKSSIGYTFEYIGYRVIKATSISGANYYRSLGTEEPGQCVIIEDEGDSISQDPDKVRILKSGYEYNGKIPKINMNTKNQEQKWYKTYCYKMILAEKSLSQYHAKGLVDRTFSFNCRPGKVKFSIKEIVGPNVNKSPRLQRLYDELLEFRRLMFCYRLIHYKDKLPDIETGLKNRDDELCRPLLQLFYGTDALKEIIETLKVFVNQRRDRKSNSLEAALYPIIKKFVFEFLNDSYEQKKVTKIVSVPYSMIWQYIINDGIEGSYDEKKKYQYETVNYGILYINSLSTFIADKFGAKLDKKTHGSILIFDIEKLDSFENVYGNQLVEDVNIEVKPITTIQEEIDEVSFNENEYERYDNYDDYDGSSKCITYENAEFETNNKQNFTSKNDISYKETNDRTHILEPSEPSYPSYPSSSLPLIDDPNKEKIINDIEKLKSVIYPSLYEDVLSVIEKEKNSQTIELIIHNAKNLQKRSPNSDVYVCSAPKCYSGDKWFMLKHPCKNFYRQKKEKEKI